MLKFDRQGLLPVVIQDDATGQVLMQAFMNEEALRMTRASGFTHFFSRSRAAIWRKGESSGHTQEVRAIFVNCEENSLLIRVVQHGHAACHMGYSSCYYRRLRSDGSLEFVAERVFDPAVVYGRAPAVSSPAGVTPERKPEHAMLESELRQLYGVYLYLRDNDMSEESNTSRLLQERSHSYLTARLADELQELAGVQSGEHGHSNNRQEDTVIEASQVSYWLMLLAAAQRLRYDDFTPHASLLSGYSERPGDARAFEERQDCLSLLQANTAEAFVQGLHLGFALIGWSCAEAAVSPLAPAEFDLGQMRRKGLVR